MFNYIVRRLMIMIPTLFGITVLCFGIINLAPGSPVEQKIQQLRFGGMGGAGATDAGSSKENAISAEVIEALKIQYGFDKPMHVRYWIWLKNLSKLDFGESFTYEEPATDIIISKFPVSMQFGIISLLLTYLICIPLGIFKAVKHGSKIDLISSVFLSALYSIPGFMLAILLLVFFSGGDFFEWFPLGGLVSDSYEDLTFFEQIKDRIWHFVLPLISYMIGNFTVLTILMKNSLLDEVKKDYVRTARAKGLSEKVVYLKHAARNALIPIVTGLGGFLAFFLAGSLLIEKIFELDGIGLMGFEAIMQRDYNIIMALIFIQSFLMLVGNLISDLAYIVVDPRIDFS
ncbi:MAG: ABC transporter permease subunit [Bacteriovoracaceae bacterium]|nr:ABC transporter permease subunit [Bacteriovoracaceae bacterium]